MFQWADAGVTPAVIASYANALRWITGAGNPWTARQVLSILTNHTYAGLVVHGYAFREGCHPPLIDREVYHRVQNLIAARRTGVPGRHGGRTGITWIVRGLLICGGCGRPMSTHTVRTGPVIRRYYTAAHCHGDIIWPRSACKQAIRTMYYVPLIMRGCISVPLNCGRAGAVQRRYGRGARDRNRRLDRDRHLSRPDVEGTGNHRERSSPGNRLLRGHWQSADRDD